MGTSTKTTTLAAMKWAWAVALGLLGAIDGCVERKLSIDSNPPGALVYLNDQEVGRTPVTRDFTWYGNYDVQLRKEGFETIKTSQKVDPPAFQWIPLDLFAELLPIKFTDHKHFSYAMSAASTRPADPDAMMSNARELQTQLESSQYTKHPATQPTTQPNGQ